MSMLTACGGKSTGNEGSTEQSTELAVFENADYLNTYVSPTELGDDATATIFKLDGYLYQLPCPISEFTEHGWEVYEYSEDEKVEQTLEFTPGQTGMIRLIKEGDECMAGLCNMATEDVSVGQCAVTVLGKNTGFYGADMWPEGMIQFSNDLTEYSSMNEVKEVCKKFEKISDSFPCYTYETKKPQKSISYFYVGDLNSDGEILYSDEKEQIGFQFVNYGWEY